ncbi:Oidioi.mRNA.OKI2018_I69.chr1.g965.t1.cds [Oikopleura dioica]|uniref:Oidioi.mRNA.OKI2018_I69.chr1.g965.t1.cds n=1 Tax=Oikopleura dioica TaxID=34765 RepID=A0ABN7SM22_OIKDI|nr:Oidioi.mRNA.OKI2018_I69.chr1.g965.t1.cds [Oikopleura dioica]
MQVIAIPNAEGYTIVPKNTTVNNVARFRLKDDINYHFMIDPGLVATPNQYKKFESTTSFWGPELTIEYWVLDENSTSRFEIDIYPFDYSNVPESLCGYEISSSGSIITTDNYPGSYDEYDECKWKLNVPDAISYSLEKNEFNVETDYDTLNIIMENKTYHFFDSNLDDVSSNFFDFYDYTNYNAPIIWYSNYYGSGDLEFGNGGGLWTTRSDLANFTSVFNGSTGYIRFSANFYDTGHSGFNITINANLRTKNDIFSLDCSGMNFALTLHQEHFDYFFDRVEFSKKIIFTGICSQSDSISSKTVNFDECGVTSATPSDQSKIDFTLKFNVQESLNGTDVKDDTPFEFTCSIDSGYSSALSMSIDDIKQVNSTSIVVPTNLGSPNFCDYTSTQSCSTNTLSKIQVGSEIVIDFSKLENGFGMRIDSIKIKASADSSHEISLVSDGCAQFSTDLVSTNARTFKWKVFRFTTSREIHFEFSQLVCDVYDNTFCNGISSCPSVGNDSLFASLTSGRKRRSIAKETTVIRHKIVVADSSDPMALSTIEGIYIIQLEPPKPDVTMRK